MVWRQVLHEVPSKLRIPMRNRSESNMFVSHRCQVENNLGVYKHVCNKLFRINADCAWGLQRREHRHERPRGRAHADWRVDGRQVREVGELPPGIVQTETST